MIDENGKRKINAFFLFCVFILYLVFNGILLARHEPWRDEANVWLMARELTPLQLFKEIKYQGHPCLWYLLVMPFAKVGLPFWTIGILSYMIMGISAGIFIQKAPLNSITKAVCLLSPIFTYFYPDIARNYCLIAMILMLLAWLFPKRNEKPVLYGLLLGLLVQADTIAIAEAGLISLMWLGESLWQGIKNKDYSIFKRILKGIWIPLASLGLWIVQFYQVSDSPQFQMRILGGRELLNEIKNFSYGILIRLTGRSKEFCLVFLLFCLILFLILAFKQKNGWVFVVAALSFMFQGTFSAVVYQLHIWHYISLCFVFIWAVWVLKLQMKEKAMIDKISRIMLGMLEILLVVFAGCMFLNWNSEGEASNLENALYGSYSDGVYTAEYIKENISPDELFVSVNVAYASTVAACLPDYDFYFAGNGHVETYADWSEQQSGQISFEELLIWVRSFFPDKEEFYLLDSGDSCLTDADARKEYEVLYQTQEATARGEEYTIYRIRLGNQYE